MRSIGDFRCDFDAAIDGSGCHDQNVGLGTPHPVTVHRVERCVFSHAGERASLLPFKLNPQQIQHITSLDNVVETVSDFETNLLPPWTDESGRTADDNVGPESFQSPDIAAGSTAMGDVANHRHGHSVEQIAGMERGVLPILRSAMLEDREDIEKALRGMFVRAVARVDHAAAQLAGEQMRRARCLVSGHDPVHAHRLDRFRGVDERFAFGHAAAGGAELDRVGAESFGGERETVPRARTVLKKQIRAGFS